MDPKRRLESPVGPRARISGREVDYFCGTSYYGLHGHPLVIAAACAAARDYGLGPATNVSTPPHEELAREACEFFAAETATCIASGYLGPAVLLQALHDEGDLVFCDAASHYSVLDAARAIGKDVVLFRHTDPDDLARQLRLSIRPGQRPLVITDGIFPSTGAVAPLADYAAALSRYERGLLCVDDAHAAGVLGRNGRGSFEHHDLARDGFHFCTTLSKAFGGSGGLIPADRHLAARIQERSRIPAGASAPPIPAVAAAAAGIRLLREHPEMRRALWDNVRHVRSGFRTLGFALPETVVPIVSLLGSPSLDLRRVCETLDREDIVVAHVAPRGYSDAPEVESIRIAVCSEHTSEQIDRLVGAVRRALR